MNSGLDWVMGGDFNVNLLSPGNNCKKKSIISFAMTNLLSQLINVATRVTPESRSLIDHIYVNSIDKINSAGVLSYALSDHQVTFINLKKKHVLVPEYETL